MSNVAFGSKPIRREEAGLGQAKRRDRPASCREGFGGGPKGLTLLAGLGQAKRRGRPASCREGFVGGPKCLTSPSEAHKKRGGRLRTGHREPATGLPAAERLLKAVLNA